MKTKKVVLIIAGVGVASVGGYLAGKMFGNPAQGSSNDLPSTETELTKMVDQNAVTTIIPPAALDSSLKKIIDGVNNKGIVPPVLTATTAPASTPVAPTSIVQKAIEKIKSKSATSTPALVYSSSPVNYRDESLNERFSNQQAIAGFNLLN